MMNESNPVPRHRSLLLTPAVLLALSTSGCALIGMAADRSKSNAPNEPRQAIARGDESFPEAEAMIEPLLADHVQSFGTPPPTLLRQYIMAKDWSMVRDDFGTITGRTVDSFVYYRGGESGKCMAWACRLYQEEQAGSWGKPKLTCEQEGYYEGETPVVVEYTCDSVESLPGEPPA